MRKGTMVEMGARGPRPRRRWRRSILNLPLLPPPEDPQPEFQPSALPEPGGAANYGPGFDPRVDESGLLPPRPDLTDAPQTPEELL